MHKKEVIFRSKLPLGFVEQAVMFTYRSNEQFLGEIVEGIVQNYVKLV